jgi:hypothetical protein
LGIKAASRQQSGASVLCLLEKTLNLCRSAPSDLFLLETFVPEILFARFVRCLVQFWQRFEKSRKSGKLGENMKNI